MLLGDAYLETFNEGKTYRLKIVHACSELSYLKAKYELLKDFIRIESIDENLDKNKKTNHKQSLYTVCDESFKFYADMFYANGVKKIPRLVQRYLTPISIAYWYMDDGSLKWNKKLKAVRICTDNFTLGEVKLLIRLLNEQHSLNASIYSQRSRFRIYIPNDNYIFSNLINEYVYDCMKYKIPLDTS